VAERLSRFACVWVPCFVAAAHIRCEPALAERPLAVLTSSRAAARRGSGAMSGPPGSVLGYVLDANAAARERGVMPGMTEAEARAREPALERRALVAEHVTTARHALLEAALGVSPRVEDGGPGVVHVDIRGLRRLVGADAAVAERLARQARVVGLPAHVGVAGSRTAAWVAAQLGRRVTIVPPGQERALLAPAPLSVLALPEPLPATLADWGIATVGDLAALPREGLGLRLGAAGLRAHDLACGRDREPFQVWPPPSSWTETQHADWEIDSLEALAGVLGALLERLAARLAASALVADGLDLDLTLTSGAHHQRAVSLAYPTRDPALMLLVGRLDLESHPPPAAVTSVVVTVHPVAVPASPGVLGAPPPPASRDLAAVLARLTALVGPDRLGAPVLVDSHRADAVVLALGEGLRVLAGSAAGTDATVPPPAPAGGDAEGVLAFRRLRPPRVVDVETVEGRPARVLDRRVMTCAGPWRTSGEWWDTGAWARDEWDVLLSDGWLCRLVHDLRGPRWYLDGVYD
jgi:protein ImuB